MSHHRSGREQHTARLSKKNKENPSNDAVFLIQNENEVLRMKNTQQATKIKQLKMQLQSYTDKVALHESEIENIRGNLQVTGFKEDVEIENEKKLLSEKLALIKSNEEILLRKIKEAREATIFEEEKVANVQNDRKGIEMEILSLRAQNEGTKVVLQNIEDENEKLRVQNQLLISKRRVFEPKQREISIQIEERIRFIKNQQQTLKDLKKGQTSKLFCGILSIIYKDKLRRYFSKIQRYSLLRKLAQKKVTQMSLIRKKYVMFIKHHILQKFRGTFRPLVEQQTAKRIISDTHKRRIKAFIWRQWRTEAKNAQFSTTRRFQFQNTIEKLAESFAKSNLFSSFNLIKYYKNNPFHQRSVMVIDNIWTKVKKRCMVQFFSGLRSAQQKVEIADEIQASSKQQSELLVTSLYFTAWAKMAKAHGIENLSIKRRYFKELKKLVALRRRRRLGQILTVTNERINKVDNMSKTFAELKKETVQTKWQSLNEEEQQFIEKKETMVEQLEEMHSEKKELYQELALLKISKYLKTKMQKAFDIWRLRKQQSKVILTIINMVESKKNFDKNFGFAKILKKRFAMLKKSINDKIQSCEFSYNYLLDENKHIKQVLDTKTHELEKTKFMGILKKICKNEKEMKLKYFYKFMRSGYKFWRFRKVCHKVDRMAEKKIKMVFMWLLKRDLSVEKEQTRIETFVENRQKIINLRLCKKAFRAFQREKQKNKGLKRALGGIFERNLELDFYVAFGKIRNEEHLYYRGLIQEDIDELQGQIDKVNEVTTKEENQIQTLKDRLADKEDIFVERKILGLYTFFVRNIKNKFGSYIKRWRDRVKRQNRVLQFAQILERKSRVMLKGRFMQFIHKKNEDSDLTGLQTKYKKFQNELESMTTNQQKFLTHHDKQIIRMKNENVTYKQDGQMYEKKTDFMVKLKLKSFAKAWGKKMLGFCFKGWKEQTDIFIQTWSGVDKTLSTRVLRETFNQFAKQMKEQCFKARIRTNLQKIYVKSYRFNVGLGFRTWRYVLCDKWITLWTQQEIRQMKRFEGLENKYKYAVGRHDGQVIYRQFDPKIRAMWNQWRQYTQKKIFNNIKKNKLDKWLFKGYGAETIRLIKRKVTKKIEFKGRFNAFLKKNEQKRMKAFFEYSRSIKPRKKSVVNLFIDKFCPFMIHKTNEQIFHLIKNYGNNQQILKKTDRTDRIQTLIETFEKKRKGILNFNMIRWRRNQYEIRIARNLLRRITRNAMNWRVKDSFFSWKLETEAKRVKQMHEEQGQVKKRTIEINRLKLFLEDFKKEKGLLLEDDGGKLVLSPRFQEKKDQQIKKDNNMRYKFISRLILSMNGYSAPVKAWNNLKTYMLVRQKYKKFAKLVRNNLRRPDVASAFRIWHKASVEFNKMFDTMERKGLIKILNRQKDKMEMEYSKKVSLEEKIQDEMKTHKVLSYHEDRKEKLAACLLLKNIRKIKMYAMLTWRERVKESKQTQLQLLEQQGSSKIAFLEDQIGQLQQSQRELKENNFKLEQAVREAVEIAELVKRITEQRDLLSQTILNKQLTCESLQEENEELNAKLYQAQKQAMNLLILSKGTM